MLSTRSYETDIPNWNNSDPVLVLCLHVNQQSQVHRDGFLLMVVGLDWICDIFDKVSTPDGVH